MSEHSDIEEFREIDQDANLSESNNTDTAIANLLEQVRLLKEKQTRIERSYEKFAIGKNPNMHSGMATGSGGPASEGHNAQIQTIRDMLE